MTDDFESYAIGAGLPFGSWTANGIVFTALIAAGGVPGISTKCLNLFGRADYNDGSYRISFTETFWFKTPRSGPIVVLANATQPLFNLQIEFDGTVTVPGIASPDPANSGIPLKFNNWHSVQLNLAFTASLGGTVDVIVEVAIDGDRHLGGTIHTGVAIASLSNVTASVNVFGFIGNTTPGCEFDEFNLAAPQFIPYNPTPGTPKIRVSAAAIEMVQLPLTAKVRVSAAGLEVIQLPSSAKVRISEAVIEIVMGPGANWQVSES